MIREGKEVGFVDANNNTIDAVVCRLKIPKSKG